MHGLHEHRRTLVPLFSLAVAALLRAPGAQADTLAPQSPSAPPAAPARVVTDTYFGTTIDDPYRYMEEFDSPEVQAWIKAQADFTSAKLRRIPGRNALLERIRDLDTSAPFRVGEIVRLTSGDVLYSKRLHSDRVEKVYLRQAASGAERVIIDPERLSEGSRHASLLFFVPSPDARLIAYGVALSGTEEVVLRVLDIESERDMPFSIDRIETAYNQPSWLPDSTGFVYARRRDLPADAPETEGYKLTAAYLHRLGMAVSDDVELLSRDNASTIPISDTDFPSVQITPGSSFALAQVKRGDDPEISLYAAQLDAVIRGDARWKRVCAFEDEVVEYAVRGATIYLVTSRGAPRFKVVSTALDAPDFASATTIVAPGEAVVTSTSAARDALYVTLNDGGAIAALRVPYEEPAKAARIEAPAETPSISVRADNVLLDGGIARLTSWVRASRTLLYDAAMDRLVDIGLSPEGRFDVAPGCVATTVRVPSHDGALVPLTIIRQEHLALDGAGPCILRGYGSYGSVEWPSFDPMSIAWLERGGILATAHVRGGGAFGRPWHDAGRMATKPNTWMDFIACGEYLVSSGYTSSAKLAGAGGSAGGILIGRAITERPDLFAAAIIAVGLSDALRMETTTNGVPNIAEFGSIASPEGFRALLAMSPYHHVREGVAYPAVLLTHGINDPRVEPWMSAKMTARLQAATSGERPILLRIDYGGGHGIGDTRQQRQESRADQWSFLLWQFGEPGFVPATD